MDVVALTVVRRTAAYSCRLRLFRIRLAGRLLRGARRRHGFVRWLRGPRPAVLPVRAFRAWRARRTRALNVARLLRSGCGSLRGGYLRSLRHTELGQYRRDVVVDCLW